MSLTYELVNRPWRVRTILRARRVGLARKVAAEAAHIAHFEALAADVRRERRRKAIEALGLAPWQAQYMADVLEATADGTEVGGIVVAMPRQHGHRLATHLIVRAPL